MAHWTEPWVGKPYVTGEFECSDMTRAVVRELRGIEIPLPSDSQWRDMAPDALIEFSEAFAEATDTPQDGDAVLMRVIGHRACLGSHIGVYAEIEGRAWVLHSTQPSGVIFCPVAHLRMIQLERLGYYRWT